MKEIQLAHGGGGEEMNDLLQELFKVLDNEILKEANDAAIISFSHDEGLNSKANSAQNSQNATSSQKTVNFSQDESQISNKADNLNFTTSSQNKLNSQQRLNENSQASNENAKENDENSKANSAQSAVSKDKFAISTDSFTLSPIFLDEETNIGKLCVCGSVNDLLMVGAVPEFLSLAFIIEEGLALSKLDKIVKSIKKECDKAGVKVVCGDTKVVPKNKGDEIYINTTAFGRVLRACETKNITQGLSVLISGDIGRHGAAVLVQRNDIEATVSSDCKCLKDEVMSLLNEGVEVVAMRDATRGGLSAVLNEWARQSKFDLIVYEERVVVKDEVKGLCELFGYEAFELANEGTFVLCVKKEDEQKALQILRKFNQNANIIGEFLQSKEARVILQNAYGAKRFLEAPKGELLPRIC
ncbi:hydrogenase expression/formation protein HypE [Campylobacter troglodytis]|uniref:hydrogenase expression/formation protein HypE n=1 Tax=Campylobacter troglodytis TaxID=654363 RepID=UPI0031F368DA